MKLEVRIQELGGTIFVNKQEGNKYYNDLGKLRKTDKGFFIVADNIKALVPITEEQYAELKTKGCFHEL